MFNSNNFTEIGHLNFDSNFSIDLGTKIKIILGPNGTGKSSLYKNIKQCHSSYKVLLKRSFYDMMGVLFVFK